MDFTLTEEQTLLRDSVQRFVEHDYGFEQRRACVEREGGFSAGHWARFATMGWLGAGLPEAVGGFGGGAVETALVAEQLGRGLVVEPYAAVAVLAAQTLRYVGGDHALRLLGEVIEGRSLPVLAWSDQPGRATLIAGGPQATHFLLPVREADTLSLFALRADSLGPARIDYRLIDGTPACDLRFDPTALDRAVLIAGPLDAAPAIALARAEARVALCAEALGVMGSALDLTREYLLQRRQFGVPLADFQALQHRLADMSIAHEQARGALHGALAGLAQRNGLSRERAVAAAGVMCARSGRFIGAQAIQLHGGIGMTNEYIVGHCFKRLMVIERLLGPAQQRADVLARRQQKEES
jgi:alkylation response protein AidB-like acyl-CoA dehydrogenase